MAIAIYSGSFDPITNGHLEILKKGSEIFDKVIIAISYNMNKKTLLSVEERLELIKKCTTDIPNIEVDSYDGLTVEYAKKKNANILLRGLRNSLDFEYELQLAQTNSSISREIKTVFLATNPEHSFISSSMVKEILHHNGNIEQYVPKIVKDFLYTKYGI